MQPSRNAGFTLIEILIVIGIIGVLAAVFVPRLVNARSNAYNSAAQLYAHNLTLWLASAEASDNTPLPGELAGDCLSTELQAQGAPDIFPTSVSDCAVAFEAGHYKVTVTSVSGKGGLAGDGTFITYY